MVKRLTSLFIAICLTGSLLLPVYAEEIEKVGDHEVANENIATTETATSETADYDVQSEENENQALAENIALFQSNQVQPTDDASKMSVRKDRNVLSITDGNVAVIDENSDLYVWGKTIGETTPKKVLSDVVSVTLGDCNGAAIDANGTLYTWGDNRNGQLGNGNTTTTIDPQKVMDNVSSVRIGGSGVYSYMAAVTTEGVLYTWGYGRYGGLGDGAKKTYRNSPYKVMENVIEVECSKSSNGAVISNTGDLYMWGQNPYGELGTGDTTEHYYPTKVMTDVTAVSLGYATTGAIRKGGILYTWGYNMYGNAGWGTGQNTYTSPELLMTGIRDVKFYAGNGAALGKDGTLYMWGRNSNGALGTGKDSNVEGITRVVGEVKSFGGNSLGENAWARSFAITKDNALLTWGYNRDGGIGNGKTETQRTPILVLEDTAYASFSENAAAAIASDGSLYLWGKNINQTISEDSTVTVVTSPTKVFDHVKIPFEIEDEQTNYSVTEDAYYQPSKQRMFRIASDEDGIDRPAGFKVTVDGMEFTSGKKISYTVDDVKTAVNEDYTGNITISKEGYYTCEIPAEYTGDYNMVVMQPETVTNPFVQMLLLNKSQGKYKSYENLIFKYNGSQVAYELAADGSNAEDIVELYPVINWTGHGDGQIWLQQDYDGANKVELTNNTMNTIRWKDCAFTAGETVFLYTKAADGTITKTATTFKICANISNTVSLYLGSGETVNLSEAENENLTFLQDLSLKIDFNEMSEDKIPITIEIKNDGTVEAVFGITFNKTSDKATAIGTLKDALSRMNDSDGEKKSKEIEKALKEMTRHGVILPHYSQVGIKSKAQIIGYATGEIVQKDGQPTIENTIRLKECRAAIHAEGSADWVTSFAFSVGTIPVPGYIKPKLKAELNQTLTGEWDDVKKKLIPQDGQEIEGKIAISAEIAAGWDGYFSVGAVGKGTLKLESVIPDTFNASEFSIKAELKAKGQLVGLSGEWTISETPEMIFWKGGEFVWENGSSEETALNFVPNLQMASLRMVATGNTLAVGVNGYVAPALSRMPDGRLLAVWQADVAGRKAVDKSGIYYSICTDGTWSDAVLVCDDGTNSFAPWIYTDGTDIAIIWQHYQTKFDTDDLPDYDTLSQQIQTVGAIYDAESGIWNTPVELDEAWKYPTVTLPEDYDEENLPATSGTRQVLNNGATRVILYTAQDENEAEQVYGLFDDGYGWGEAVQLTDVAAGVNGFNAILNDSELQILYTSGDYANSELMLYTAEMKTDLEVDSVSYVQQTFTGNNDLSLMVTVKNTGAITSNGVHVRVLNGSQELHSEDIGLRFLPGETDTMYANCPMPEKIPYEQLTVEVTPLDTVDADLTNNTGVCVLKRTDISIEHFEAGYVYGNTEMLLQVVNRGQVATAVTTAHIHKETADGEEIGTIEVPALSVGEAVYLQAEITTANPDDMLYIEIPEMEDENLIGNNSNQAIVLMQENQELPDETLVVGSILTSDTPKVRLYPENTSNADITADMQKDSSVIAVSANIQVTESDVSSTSKVYNYTISDIQPGTYKLAVSCGNQTGKIETITIGNRVQLHDIQLYTLGDVNNDGRVNVVDAYLIRCHAAQLKTLDGTQQLAADVNRDGRINVVDAYLVRCYAAQLIKEFPAA